MADPAYTSVVIPDASAQACVGFEGLYAVLVKHPSPVRTVEGITTQSSVDDLRAAFGERLVTRTVDYHPEWVDYAVYDGQGGYAFVPQDDGSLILIAGTRQLVDSVAGRPHGIC